jgi:hypothetical protein
LWPFAATKKKGHPLTQWFFFVQFFDVPVVFTTPDNDAAINKSLLNVSTLSFPSISAFTDDDIKKSGKITDRHDDNGGKTGETGEFYTKTNATINQILVPMMLSIDPCRRIRSSC